ncbi:MAG: metallophosphoesterase family protein [Candidatus Omnitrophica bacterium]|nr:metallophosphoesterase family protein [Candidatus Omnitrophota bacterium]
MKIGVISDTHMPDKTIPLPAKLIEDFKTVDMVIHAGDITSLATLESLKTICPHLKAVRGNMDDPEVRKLYPEKDIIIIGKFRIGVAHGFGPPQGLLTYLEHAFQHDHVHVIIFGHSHKAFNETRNGILFFNPGSPTDSVFAPYKSYGIIEINDTIKATIVRL